MKAVWASRSPRHLSEKKYFELRGRGVRYDQYADLLQPGVTNDYARTIRSSESERNMQLVGKFYF